MSHTHKDHGHTTKAASYKKEQVAKVAKLLSDYPIVGILNMENLPASALQQMRGKLRGKAEMFMTKRRLIKLALQEAEKSKKNLLQLDARLVGMPALLLTKENPFSIYKIIKKAKSPAYAKGGQIAPHDIIVKAGPTPFAPGPVIGELGKLGIKAGVDAGKIAIKEDKVIVKEGKPISAEVASQLMRLDIKPMEIGLDITAIYEAGTVYDKKVLDIDEDQFKANLAQAAVWARNLAFEAAYPVKEFMPDMIGKLHREAKAVGTEANILVAGVMPELLAKAQRQMMGVKETANIE
ncbi:MAG: 50S ribosomal protein L10 [Nanoarchaeota archaeon]|nr:50S ribosomal protein L10 [Nanoarchaeota archaeon]